MQILNPKLKTALGLTDGEIMDISLAGSLRLIERLEDLVSEAQAMLTAERRFVMIAYGNVRPYSATEMNGANSAN